MKTQHEKNKEILMDRIEMYCNQPMNDSVAEHLSVYRGALKALCMMDKEGKTETIATLSEKKEAKTAEKAKPTPELDGDTEFEQVVMAIPTDKEHMKKLFDVFADHMEQLSIVNKRAYDNIIMKLREVARR